MKMIMNEFLIYLLKASGGITVFVIPYFLLMRSDPNLKLKRIYLLSAIIISFLFPLAGIQRPVSAVITTPAFFIDPGAVAVIGQRSTSGSDYATDFFLFVRFFYISGIFLLLLRNLFFYFKWRKDTKGGTSEGNIQYVHSDQTYTIFTKIFLPKNLQYDHSKKSILIHENAHIRQYHYIDLLLLEIALLLTWFNPFIWLISGMIRENHEHLADREVLKAGINPAHYKAQLVNQALGVRIFSLGHQFNYSLTKKRFEMMKTQRSSVREWFKLAILLPFVILALGFVTGKAQSDLIKGRVYFSDTGEPATGASVVIKNTTTGTVVDKEGTFTIKPDSRNTILVISFVGYETIFVEAESGEELKKLELPKRIVDLDPIEIKKSATSQDTPGPGTDVEVFYIVEEMPSFPGGMDKFKKYLQNELKYPKAAQKEKIEGDVYVQYTISKTGKVEDVEIVKSDNDLLNEEALRVIREMPDWQPGTQRGKKVDVIFTTPVRFRADRIEILDK